jgi:hypothetical protein
LILVRLQGFVKRAAHVCIRNILAHVRVLAPTVPLEKLTEEAKNQEFLDVVERVELEVDALAEQLFKQLDIKLPPPDDNV